MALSGFRGTAGGPGDVMVWRVRSGERVAHLTGFAEEITALAITQDEVLVAGSAGEYQGSTLWLWRLPSSEPVISISSSALGAGPLAVTPDGSLLAAATYFCGIRLWRIPSRELAGTIDTEPGTTSVATTRTARCCSPARRATTSLRPGCGGCRTERTPERWGRVRKLAGSA
jgi:WD40 repeat protein